MYRLLILSFLGIVNGDVSSALCSSDNITQPITDFDNFIKQLESPHAKTEAILEKIKSIVDEVVERHTYIYKNCREDKIEVLKKLQQFGDNIFNIYDILEALALDDLPTATKKFESIRSKYILHYLITQIEYSRGRLPKIIDVAKLVEDMEIKNKMHAGIIYTLNETTMYNGRLLVPDLKETALNADKDVASKAKLNLKLLTERSNISFPEPIVALNEIDSELAEQVVKETVKRVFTNEVYTKAFVVEENAPTYYLKAVALKEMHDIITSMFEEKDLKNILVYNKIHSYAQYKVNAEDNDDSKAKEILSQILNN